MQHCRSSTLQQPALQSVQTQDHAPAENMQTSITTWPMAMDYIRIVKKQCIKMCIMFQSIFQVLNKSVYFHLLLRQVKLHVSDIEGHQYTILSMFSSCLSVLSSNDS